MSNQILGIICIIANTAPLSWVGYIGKLSVLPKLLNIYNCHNLFPQGYRARKIVTKFVYVAINPWQPCYKWYHLIGQRLATALSAKRCLQRASHKTLIWLVANLAVINLPWQPVWDHLVWKEESVTQKWDDDQACPHTQKFSPVKIIANGLYRITSNYGDTLNSSCRMRIEVKNYLSSQVSCFCQYFRQTLEVKFYFLDAGCRFIRVLP